ncbi:hypothetical protein CAPTEDRAFT_208431 [Capitella teleta]|uniref:Uncharacterized protein n=1 Tax=Capitella teleta TaxID=283909 RepID=R7TU20_CAPTE|nr:hypothetical protein CAPTEDRAFT_208431 [Capitella teleta]|eukprot:ELT97102.1 hypothetical protein CAPTEDRAFT_208431 [Capitella teleta]
MSRITCHFPSGEMQRAATMVVVVFTICSLAFDQSFRQGHLHLTRNIRPKEFLVWRSFMAWSLSRCCLAILEDSLQYASVSKATGGWWNCSLLNATRLCPNDIVEDEGAGLLSLVPLFCPETSTTMPHNCTNDTLVCGDGIGFPRESKPFVNVSKLRFYSDVHVGLIKGCDGIQILLGISNLTLKTNLGQTFGPLLPFEYCERISEYHISGIRVTSITGLFDAGSDIYMESIKWKYEKCSPP